MHFAAATQLYVLHDESGTCGDVTARIFIQELKVNRPEGRKVRPFGAGNMTVSRTFTALCFVSGHDFSRARKPQNRVGLQSLLSTQKNYGFSR